MTAASDAFTRSAGALGSNWADASWTGAEGVQIKSSGVAGGIIAAENFASWWTADSFQPNQMSEITLADLPTAGDWVGCMVRASAPGVGYLAIYFPTDTAVMLFDQKGAGGTTELGAATAPLATGDKRSLVSEGQVLTVKQNDTVLLTYNDTANLYATGAPGIAMFENTGTISAWDANDNFAQAGGSIEPTLIQESGNGTFDSAISDGSTVLILATAYGAAGMSGAAPTLGGSVLDGTVKLWEKQTPVNTGGNSLYMALWAIPVSAGGQTSYAQGTVTNAVGTLGTLAWEYQNLATVLDSGVTIEASGPGTGEDRTTGESGATSQANELVIALLGQASTQPPAFTSPWDSYNVEDYYQIGIQIATDAGSTFTIDAGDSSDVWEATILAIPVSSGFISSLYADADPTALDSYHPVQEGNASYSVPFTVAKAGLLKEIRYYSPAGDTATTPDKVGLFADNDTTALFEADSNWKPGMTTRGWQKTDVTPYQLQPDITYFAVIAMTTGAFDQAYLYQGSTQWFPATSIDGNITAPATVDHPAGASAPYQNSEGFTYPGTAPPGTLNWLIDVGIDFGDSVDPVVDTESLDGAEINIAYSAQLAGSGGSVPYSWAVTTGALPDGLTMSSSGLISGTPTVKGTFDFTVTLTDDSEKTATADLSIVVSDIVVAQTGVSGHVTSYDVTAKINSTDGAGAQPMRVLVPDTPAEGVDHAFLWLLPVEPGQGTTFGDSIATIQALDAQNTYNLTCIQPGFPIDPWYANSDQDPDTQQDSFIMALVAWAEANLASSGTEKHYLIGFSKSGFGGQELFWHHQDKFAAVASWDTACDYQTLGQYDGEAVFGDQAGLDAITLYDPHLQTWKAEGDTATVNRIWLGAGINLIQATSDYSDRLTADAILHTYDFVEADSHNWAPTPGWVGPALEAIIGTADAPPVIANMLLAAGII